MINDREHQALLRDCVRYFKENKGFNRVLAELKKKWQKYGRIAGTIKLENPEEEEKKAISGLLGEICDGSSIKFYARDFAKALSETKYADIQPEELLGAYYGRSLKTNKEEKAKEIGDKAAFFDVLTDNIIECYGTESGSKQWLDAVRREKKYGYRILISEYNCSSSRAEGLVRHLCAATEALQKKAGTPVRLAVLAAETTGNPHYFDRGTQAGKLLIQILSYIHKLPDTQSAEDILYLYYMSGIRPDDISSYTTLYGIRLYTEDGEHQSYQHFIKNKEAYLVALSNLNRIVKADSKRKIVFIFENQMVFSHMCETFAEQEVSLLCTSGQMKTASLMVIDLLCKSGCQLYYSGDIDPEGISIADKIIQRHPGQIIPWRMGVEDYLKSLSEEAVGMVRLKKLDKIKTSALRETADALRQKDQAGYQELLLSDMQHDMEQLLGDTF